MELIAFMRVLLRRWWLVVLPVLVAGGLLLPQLLAPRPAAVGGYATSFKYSAAQEFNLPERDGDYQDVWLASEFVVNAFTEWMRGSTFRAEIARIVGAEMDLSLLGLATDNARSIGVVQMSYPDAAQLEQLAAAAITVLQTRSQDYFPHLGGAPARLTLLDAPVIAAAPPPLTSRFGPVLQLLLALAAGVGLAFLAEYVDPTLRRAPELEAQGWVVLAQVPRA